MDCLLTLKRVKFEMATTLLFRHLAMTILDPDRSGIVSLDFVDKSYHGDLAEDGGELCTTNLTDGTTTCHRYCTVYVVSNGKPVTLAMTYVRSDEKEADASSAFSTALAPILSKSISCSLIVDSTTSE